ncbi:hypothetical protein DICVIV_05203 [Dictyocaulus viviparus]|uniref:C2H2-type domain-containing protein n=1 Tax=Dictyocaulus viviparus TaxID=29172 RepID=A0A0D8XXZ3_DICVI|nr:hypothetical protein DICVIV_05203 [Dictyocaulus viviparus]
MPLLSYAEVVPCGYSRRVLTDALLEESTLSQSAHVIDEVCDCFLSGIVYLLIQLIYVYNGGRYPISPISKQYLGNHQIYIMNKSSELFPFAVYWCSLCDYHMCNIEHVNEHVRTAKHTSAMEHVSEWKHLVTNVPKMTNNQLEAINILANKTIENSVQDSNACVFEKHLRLSNNIKELFQRTVFREMGVEGHIQLYGSVLSKTAIDSSDLNLSIDIPNVDCSDALECMRRIADLLTIASKDFETSKPLDVKLTTCWPMCISLNMSNIDVRIAWKCENGLKCGHLLSIYTEIRPQYADLCRLVRKWAKMRPLMSHEKKNDPMLEDFYENRDLFEQDVAVIVRCSYVL